MVEFDRLLPFIPSHSFLITNGLEIMLGATRYFALLLVTTLISSFAVTARGGEVIRIATEDYPPYVAPYLNNFGVLGQIATEAFRLEGIDVEFDFFPDNRAYLVAAQGKFDATMPWAKREERFEIFHYGEPIIESDQEVFFYRNGFQFHWNPEEQNYEDIKGLTVGAIQGSNYGKKFMEAERKGIIEVSRVVRTVQNFKMLSLGRIDLMISPERIALYALTTKVDEKVRKNINLTLAIDEPVEYDYLLISKKSKNRARFLEAMNRGLRKLKKSGRHREIIDAFNKKYNGLTRPAGEEKK